MSAATPENKLMDRGSVGPPARTNSNSTARSDSPAWEVLSLAFVCGCVDAISLILLKVFTSIMSGNTTTTGLKLGQGRLEDAAQSFLPIPMFALGVLLSALFETRKGGQDVSRVIAWAVIVLCAGLGVLAVNAPNWTAVSLLSLAMGMLTMIATTLRGQSVSFGAVTGDLKNVGQNAARGLSGTPVPDPEGPGDTAWRRAGVALSVWAAFLIGAVAGSVLEGWVGIWALVLPILVLLALLAGNLSKQANAA